MLETAAANVDVGRMPVNAAFKPDARFAALGGEFADPVRPAAFPQTILRHRNDRAAKTLGLEGLSDPEWIAAFGRFEPLPEAGQGPIAMRYHGHQFRSYNPDLGDGRGFLFAQLREVDTDRLIDLGTKGSGQTPWSRNGDGRLTLKGAVREALATAMLEALGVPTGRTLSVIETGEDLVRHDEPSPTRGAVLVRSLWSHVRFGTFQRHAYFDRRDLIMQLIDHVVEAYYPRMAETTGEERVVTLLHAIVQRSARLAARWMAAGFVHGVLNTDNMNVTGESFDYGPYRFLPYYEPGFTAAYFDETRLYAYGRQPEAVFWNLQQLAACFALVIEDHGPLIDALNSFSDAYHDHLRSAFTARLGVKRRSPDEDTALTVAALNLLKEGGEAMRWEPLFFDWFGGKTSERRAMNSGRAPLYAGEAFDVFRAVLDPYEPANPTAILKDYFRRPEPEELLYPEIEAIWAPIAATDDWSLFDAKLASIETARKAYALEPWAG